MRLIDLRNPVWRKRAWTLATIILVIVLASHPELRLLVPFLEAIGLDVFFALAGLQIVSALSGALMPVIVAVWRKSLPSLRRAHRLSLTVFPLAFLREFARYAVFHWLGDPGPRLWLRLHTLGRLARLGPRPAWGPAPRQETA